MKSSMKKKLLLTDSDSKDEMIDQLKEKFQSTTSRSEKVRRFHSVSELSC